MRRATIALLVLFSLVTLFAAACRQRGPEKIEFEPGSATADGLRKVEGAIGLQVLLKPGVRMSDYTRVIVDPFMVSYGGPRGESDIVVRTLDEETERRLLGVLQDTFIAEMQNSRHFEVVEEPGPETVRVQGWLYDLVVDEPPTDDPRNFPLCFAEMIVWATVRNSETAEALARVGDRVKLSCEDRHHARFYTANWRDVSATIKPWARFLRRWLEDLHTMPPVSG